MEQGACLFLSNKERVDLKQPVSTRSSILLGELIAIKIALESIKLEMEKLLVNKVMLFSDSQSADRLAKEAAVDAENMPKVCTPLTSIDIKRAVKEFLYS